AASIRLRESADVRASRGRTPPHRLLHRGGGAVCAAGQQAGAVGIHKLPRLFAGGAAPADAATRRGGAGEDRVRSVSEMLPRAGSAAIDTGAGLRTRRHVSTAFGRDADWKLSSEPAKHVHRQADPADVSCRVQAGESAYAFRWAFQSARNFLSPISVSG